MSVIVIRETQPTATGFAARLIFDGGDGGEYEINVTDPFTPQEERRLEWYFEEWLTFPMLNGKKAEAAKNSVASYGEGLFNQVFRADADAYSQYRQLRRNLKQVKIEIVGNSPEFHALHWEAMQDKDLPRPLAVDCVMIRKQFAKSAPVAAQMAPSPVINLLVVIARPDEEDDVGYRTISRPLIEVIQTSQLPVNVDLLRPGTYESLERHLEAKGAGYYHVIHFDCHGALMSYEDIQSGVKRNRYTYQSRWGRDDIQSYEGVKAFLFLDGESKGKADPVEAGELADLLTGKGIPVCILNACQSGKQVRNEGDEGEKGDEGEIRGNSRETSLGSRLMAAGMQMVVAMGYSVTVSAARLMMEQVYENLFAGKEIREAIRLGRRELFNNKTRKAYFNTDIDLEDWLLPVVYSNQRVNLSLREFTPEEEEEYFEKLGDLYEYTPPEYGFIGRDLEILKIEKALFRYNILLLQGMGGTGKTTLLTYLRSWWETTNFARDIFYFGYDEKPWTLTQILFAIGKRIYQRFEFARFQAMNQTAQVQKLLKELKSQNYILILDNLESVTGQALAIQNTLPSEEQKQLQDFLIRLVDGKTKVILGSRSGESWLQGAFKQNIYRLQGLDKEARTELSNKILERNVGDERKIAKIREDGDFQKLMKVLAGYPLAMEVVLGNLKNLSPQEVLGKLQAADINLDTGSEDKTQSILKCVEYSHSNLSPDAQKLLLCLAPFSGFIDRGNIPNYVKWLQKLESFQDYDFEKFDDAMQEAINWGLLSPMDEDIPQLLQIQPVFPFFLQAKLAELDAVTQEALGEGFKNHYLALAGLYYQYMESKDARERKFGIVFCRLEYENLYNGLQICLEKQKTVDIFFCLDKYFGLVNDIQSKLKLAETVNLALEQYPPDYINGENGYEIVVAIDLLANCYLQTQNYQQAKQRYEKKLKIIDKITNLEETRKKSDIASTYHQLGIVAQELREYQQARDYYQQALEINIEYGDKYNCASTYHQLGYVAQELGEYHQARDYYQQALEINIEYGDKYNCASTYHQLGMVAQELGEYHQARDYYQQALEIFIEYGDKYKYANTYHNLGIVAQKLGEYHQARDYYQKALKIFIEYENRYSCARIYHNLGVVAHELGEYHQARDYYQQALEIFIEYGDKYSCASTYYQLGKVAEELGELGSAKTNYLQDLVITVEFNDEHGLEISLRNLARFYQATQDEDLLIEAAKVLGMEVEELKAAINLSNK
ncbi:MAG: tetratricopeptide repeat protein [Calothrix sp. MO_167.B12]|nr:tetratricopeptide repeat protein [Calothrix sp. MO_167.B12]